MHTTCGWTGLRTAVFALALAAWSAPGARAAALQTDSITSQMQYGTLGNVDSTGVSGTPIISIKGESGASFTAPSAFNLGTFQVGALPSGSSTTYSNTPFHITLTVNQVDGQSPSPNQTPVVINGVLNGTVTGGTQSSVVATFDNGGMPSFLTGNYKDTLNVFDNPLSLVPSTTNAGQTTAQAQILVANAPSPTPAPEPATVALFLTAIAGYGLRRRIRAAR